MKQEKVKFEDLTGTSRKFIEAAAQNLGQSKFFVYDVLARELSGNNPDEWIEGSIAIAEYADVWQRTVFVWNAKYPEFKALCHMLPCDGCRTRLSIRKKDLDKWIAIWQVRPGRQQKKGKYNGDKRTSLGQ